MNGIPAGVFLWFINILLGLLLGAVGIIVKMHKDSDDEHRKRIEGELALVRQRVHDLSAMVGRIDAEQRFMAGKDR